MKKLTPWNSTNQQTRPANPRVHIRHKPNSPPPHTYPPTPSDWCQLENLRPWHPVGLSKI